MVDALNLNSIRFTNFPMNTSSDPIMPSFVLSHIHFRIWLIVSPALLHILHFVCSCDLLIFPLIALLGMACSWAANIFFSQEILFHALGFHFKTIATYPDSTLPYFIAQTGHATFFSPKRFFSGFFCFLASIVVFRIGSDLGLAQYPQILQQ